MDHMKMGVAIVKDVGSLKVNIWVNKSLSLLDLSTIEPEVNCADENISYCKKHKDEQLKMFCTGCEQLICRDCTIIDHRGHKYCFAAEVIDEHKEKLKKEVTKAISIKNEIESRLKTLQEFHEKAETNKTVTEKAIDVTINKQKQMHIQAFEEKRINLKEDLRFITSLKKEKIVVQESSLQKHLMGLTSSIELTENLLSNGSMTDVLAVSKDVRLGLSKQSSEPEILKIKEEELKPVYMPELHVTKQLMTNGINEFTIVSDPDPDKCVVMWSVEHRLDSIEVYIKDHQGFLLNIMKERISIHLVENDNRSLLLEGLLSERPLVDGLWTLFDLRIHQTKSADICASIKNHDLKNRMYEVNFKVDRHIIKGNPIRLCFSNEKLYPKLADQNFY